MCLCVHAWVRPCLLILSVCGCIVLTCRSKQQVVRVGGGSPTSFLTRNTCFFHEPCGHVEVVIWFIGIAVFFLLTLLLEMHALYRHSYILHWHENGVHSVLCGDGYWESRPSRTAACGAKCATDPSKVTVPGGNVELSLPSIYWSKHKGTFWRESSQERT